MAVGSPKFHDILPTGVLILKHTGMSVGFRSCHTQFMILFICSNPIYSKTNRSNKLRLKGKVVDNKNEVCGSFRWSLKGL